MGWLDNIEKAQDGKTEQKKDNISSPAVHLKTLDVDRLNFERQYGFSPSVIPEQPSFSQDDRTEIQKQQAVQRAIDYENATAWWQMPLGYLANPDMFLEDVGMKEGTEAEEYRERIRKSKAGMGDESLYEIAKKETPKAVFNTAVALAFSPNLRAGTVANELFNPLAGMDEVVKDAAKAFGKEMMQQAPVGAYRVTELAPISTEPTLQLKSTMANNPKGLHTQVNKKGMINTQNALNFIKNNEGQAKYDLVRQGFGETLPKNMKYDEFKKTVSDQLIPLQREVRQVRSAPYGINHIGYNKEAAQELKYLPEIENHIKELEGYKDNLAAYRKEVGYADEVPDSYILEMDLEPRIASRKKRIEEMKALSSIEENKSIVLKNPEKLGWGNSEHIKDDESTLAHINYILDKEYPNTMRVTQMQSDWAQGVKKFPSKESVKSSIERSKAHTARQAEIAKKAVQQPDGSWLIPGDDTPMSNDVYQKMLKGDTPEIIKLRENELGNYEQKQLLKKGMEERMLQEAIAEASSRKIGKIQIPTRETAAKIQDYRISSGTESGFSEEISNLNQTLTNLEGAKLSASPSDIPLIDKEIKRVKGELAGFKPKYEPQHETILKKYDQNVKYLEKLGINPKVITDKKGHTWYEFNTPDTFLKGKGEIKAFEQGGVIKDNRGQWAHPGKVTEIDSNNITMKGVNYPVLGISDTGDTRLMQPGGEYTFEGEKVTEIPLKAQEGKTIPWLDTHSTEKDDPNYSTDEKEIARNKVDSDAVEFLNSYYNSDTFKQRYNIINRPYTDYRTFETKDPLDRQKWTIKKAYEDYYPHLIKNDTNYVGSRVSFPMLNELVGAPTNANILLSKTQADFYNADLEKDILPHEFSHTGRDLTNAEEFFISTTSDKSADFRRYREQYKDALENKGEDYFDQNRPYGKRTSFSAFLKDDAYPKDGVKENLHDMAPDEIHSDLDAVRYRLFKRGIYDTRKGDMTRDQYDKMLKDPEIMNNFHYKRLEQHFGDPGDFLNYMNKVASNTKPIDSRIAKNGKTLKITGWLDDM